MLARQSGGGESVEELREFNLLCSEMINCDNSVQVSRCVYVIDDNADVRKSLHFLLSVSAITAWPFATATDFIEQLPELVPGPILLDVRMPEIDGLEMLSMLKERAVDWPVIVMTAHSDVRIAVGAMKLGAIDFLEKPFKTELLEKVLDHAFELVDQADGTLRLRAEARERFDRLSRREREVMASLVDGAPNKVAARELGLSARTVEMHRANALGKLGLKSIAEVVKLEVVAGFLDRSSRPQRSLN